MYQYHVFNLLLPFIGAITGMGIALLVRPKTPASPKLILAFSGAFLLGITLFHLMPIVFNSPNLEAGVWIMGGVLLQILLEYISQGVEHGHAHGDKFKDRFPFFLLLSLCVHAFIEGMPLNGDNPLVWGILVHKFLWEWYWFLSFGIIKPNEYTLLVASFYLQLQLPLAV